MNNFDKEEILHYYCDNGMKKLQDLSLKILSSIKSFVIYDYDEFYSIALEELSKAINTYNPNNELQAKFETYLSIILSRKFMSEFSRKNRKKRGEGILTISLDKEVEDTEISILETIPSSINIENEVIMGDYSDEVRNYLNSLSKKQRSFAELIVEGYSIEEAKKILKLGRKEAENMLKFMRSYEKRGLLKKVQTGGQTMSMKKQAITMEKYKPKRMNANEIVRKMNDCTINFEHPLQRYAGQWSNKMKSDLISDMMQNNPIPALTFAEQMQEDGTVMIFNLDGKQRCTTVSEFKNDNFKIAKNVSRSIITYQRIKKDNNGKVIKNEKGYPISELIEYDITNKKYSQLPLELQEAIDNYNFDITYYLSCSDEEIAYHIQRYNQGKAMNGIQKGITHLGEDFSREVKSIAALPFFQDNDFSFLQFKNGTIDRVVIESVMAVNFLNDWKKSPEDIAKFLNKNATMDMFYNVEDSISRIEDVITDDISDLFNSKNTFLWVVLFERFKELNIEDDKFNDFLIAFKNKLQFKEINGTTFESIDEGKNTKDKSLLIKKINHLTFLLNDFFANQKGD